MISSDERLAIHKEQEKARRKLADAAKENPSATLVKLVAERVYKHIKLEFNSPKDQDALMRLKVRSLMNCSTDPFPNLLY